MSDKQNPPKVVPASSELVEGLPFHLRPYRSCMGLLVFNADHQVFVGERADIPGAWQLPQGGISADEDPVVAGLRELEEETGIKNVSLIGITKNWYTYDFPRQGYVPNHSEKYRGQQQKFLAVRFAGTDDEITLDNHEEIEFARWKWVDLETIPGLIVDFKRPNYEAAVTCFRYCVTGQTPDTELVESL